VKSSLRRHELEKKLLTVAEAAQAMGIGRSLLYRLVMSGEIRSVVVGGRARRIPVAALDEWIARQQAEAEAGEWRFPDA
jgi:excisionase family DNA binding protein